jgi:hypothetical protein
MSAEPAIRFPGHPGAHDDTRQVEEVLSHSRPYGVAEAMETALARARLRAEESERAAVTAENP